MSIPVTIEIIKHYNAKCNINILYAKTMIYGNKPEILIYKHYKLGKYIPVGC